MWSSGETALLRFVRYGKVRWAVPHVVVEDSPELVALYLPVGAPAKAPVWDGRPIRGQVDREWPMRDHVWHTSSELRLIRWDSAHCIELLWDPETWNFKGWYVNIQEPVRRSQLGFDTDDLVLDVWVEDDGTWRWKDEDELEEAVRLGRFNRTQAAAIRAEGERVVAEQPWPTGWEDWRPDPEWPLPQLPETWNVV
jgi:uncharacterized protein